MTSRISRYFLIYTCNIYKQFENTLKVCKAWVCGRLHKCGALQVRKAQIKKAKQR